MEFSQFKTLVIAEAAQAGLADYELYYRSRESTEVSMFNGEPDSFTSTLDGGVAFRCIVGGHMGAAYTQELSESQARSLVLRAMDNAMTLEKEGEAFFARGGADYPDVKSVELPVLSAEELIRAAKDGSDALKASHEMITDRCSAEATTLQIRTSLVNSRGVDLNWVNSVDAMVLSAVVSDGREDNDDFEIRIADLSKLDLKEMAASAASRAAAMLGAQTAPTGACPVIFPPRQCTACSSPSPRPSARKTPARASPP